LRVNTIEAEVKIEVENKRLLRLRILNFIADESVFYSHADRADAADFLH